MGAWEPPAIAGQSRWAPGSVRAIVGQSRWAPGSLRRLPDNPDGHLGASDDCRTIQMGTWEPPTIAGESLRAPESADGLIFRLARTSRRGDALTPRSRRYGALQGASCESSKSVVYPARAGTGGEDGDRPELAYYLANLAPAASDRSTADNVRLLEQDGGSRHSWGGGAPSRRVAPSMRRRCRRSQESAGSAGPPPGSGVSRPLDAPRRIAPLACPSPKLAQYACVESTTRSTGSSLPTAIS